MEEEKNELLSILDVSNKYREDWTMMRSGSEGQASCIGPIKSFWAHSMDRRIRIAVYSAIDNEQSTTAFW